MKKYLLLLLFLPWVTFATTYQQVEKQLQQELEQAQQGYKKQVEHIADQRAPKIKKLNELEGKLVSLRSDLAADIRAKDERYLSLEQLQTRLGQWQDQNRFIHNQLNSLLEAKNSQPSAVVEQMSQRLSQLSDRLMPQWHPSDAIQDNGAVVSGTQLTIGPLHWFATKDGQLYLSDTSGQKNTLKMRIEPSEPETIINSQAQHRWQWLATDITAGKASTIAAKRIDYWQKLRVGGIWIYPILGFGLFSLCMAIVKGSQLIRLPRLNSEFAKHCVQKNSEIIAQSPRHWQQELAALAWRLQRESLEQTADQLLQQLMRYKVQLERGMSLLATTAAVAPLLGLLGTVSGMIHTFEMMNLFGNKDQSLLSGGISEALITTELGLVVAIPALLAHSYLSRKHQSYLAQLESDTVLLAHLGKSHQEKSVC